MARKATEANEILSSCRRYMFKNVLETLIIDLISSDDFSFPACIQPYTKSEDSPMRTKVIHYDQLSVNKKTIRF